MPRSGALIVGLARHGGRRLDFPSGLTGMQLNREATFVSPERQNFKRYGFEFSDIKNLQTRQNSHHCLLYKHYDIKYVYFVPAKHYK
jgi:hypothetical protein